MEHSLLIQSLVAAIFVSISASLLGSFVILKKMALVGDALSHVALPGLAFGLIFNFNPFIGAFLTLFIAVLGIWFLKYQTNLPIDTLVGIFFTASLAIGVLLIPEHDLLEAMFGNIASLTIQETNVLILLSIFIIVLILTIHKKLAINMLSEELAHSANINNKKLEFLYLFIFALAVAIGVRFVGALLMGALVIIPAASSKNISRSLNSYMSWSVIFGIVSAVIGILFSFKFNMSPGPFIIIAGAVLL